jgi:hypothetical protein
MGILKIINFQTFFAIAYFAIPAFFLFVFLRFGDACGKKVRPGTYWVIIALFAAMVIGALWILKLVVVADIDLARWPKPQN